MKIVLTWLAYNRDFIELDDAVLQLKYDGFTMTMHKDLYLASNFDKHVILTTVTGDRNLERRCKMLEQAIKEEFKSHNIEFSALQIKSEDLQDFKIIESAIRSHIQTYDADIELSVIAGSGPTVLNMVWTSLWIVTNKRFKLLLMKDKKYTEDKKTTGLVEVQPYANVNLDNKLKEFHLNNKVPENIFRDDSVTREYDKAHMIAQAIDVNVLILGETGCGKDVMAKYIFNNSPLKNASYKAINCASLMDELLYSELFGHEKGAFTGATDQRMGVFEECNGGTLFLDEIGDISPLMQQSLLRVIENKEIKRAGSNKIIENINVRIIAATNKDLYEKCKKGTFRWDLYYRLCTQEIEILPYRERTKEERKKAFDHFLESLEYKWGKSLKFDSEAKAAIQIYSFPGNFREIHNTINGLFAIGKETIVKEDLPKRFFDIAAQTDETYDGALKKHCGFIYKKYKLNLANTCSALGYSNSTQLKKKLIDWGIYNH